MRYGFYSNTYKDYRNYDICNLSLFLKQSTKAGSVIDFPKPIPSRKSRPLPKNSI
jgi:hypothetical protein